MARTLIAGPPGDVYTNTTAKPLYQLIVNWANTCGVCAQFDHQIGPPWPLPYHRRCRCRQVIVPPGATAEPFVDYIAIAEALDAKQKTKLVGASSWRLFTAGVVEWSDIVTPQRVRPLHEVVALNGITVDAMKAAGVRADRAEKAYATVNTPVHQLVAEHRRDQLASLEAAGLDRGSVARLAAETLVERVGLVNPLGESEAFRRRPPAERLKRFVLLWRPGQPPPPIKSGPDPADVDDDQAGDDDES